MFLLSKIVGYLLQPMVWIIILLIWSLITKNLRRKKILGVSILLMFFFFSNNFIIKNLMVSYQAKPRTLKPGERYAYGIVLGGFMSYDEVYRDAFFNPSGDRFIQTARLYKLGHIGKIIVSGGNGIFASEEFREADYIKANLMDVGVPAGDILIERNSKNTIENSLFVKKITDSIQYHDTALLITSAFHIPRAVRNFDKAGVKVKPFPCAYLITPSDRRLSIGNLLPSAIAFEFWQLYLKEIVGRLK